MRKFVALAALSLLTVAAFAQNPLGTWRGKVKADVASMPKGRSPQEQQQIDKMFAEMKTLVFTLNLKGNKAFTFSLPAGGKRKSHLAEGTWTQKGSVITLNTVKSDGKPMAKPETQTLTIERGGRQLTMNVPNTPGKVQIIFTR